MPRFEAIESRNPDHYRNDIVISDIEPRTGNQQNENMPASIGVTTRKIVRPEFIQNPYDDTARVKATLMHQKRSRQEATELWRDADSFNLSHVRDGEEIRLKLRSIETKRLLMALLSFYHQAGSLEQILAEFGTPIADSNDPPILDSGKLEVLQRLYDLEGEGLFELLEEIEPNLIETVGLRKQHELRRAALERFHGALETSQWTESDWQAFFESNTWIFGFGLSYQFLHLSQSQPAYGGLQVNRLGAERGDFLFRTEASRAKFTVLVEIKTPETRLLRSSPHRANSGYYGISGEMSQGISQIQANCETWLVSGSQDNAIALHEEQTHVHQPKGILIIGHTDQLDDDDQIGSFERFRLLLQSPEIVTFDELLARATYLVENATQTPVNAPKEVDFGDIDNVPF